MRFVAYSIHSPFLLCFYRLLGVMSYLSDVLLFFQHRIQLTSTMRLFWLMLLIMPSEMTQESTGSAIPSTSTGSLEVLLLLGKNTGDCVERDTATTSNVLHAGQTGRETTPFLFAATVNLSYYGLCFPSVSGHLPGGNISGYLEFEILDIEIFEILF